MKRRADARNRRRIAATHILYVLLLCASLWLQGCPSKRPPGVHFPIANGSHSTLPTTDQQILIWADPPLVDLATEWLRAHHYSRLLTPHDGPLGPPQLAHDLSTRNAALAVAQEMKAEVVLVLEREATKEGALIEPHCGPRYHVGVDVRGLSAKNGDTSLRGHAHYPQCVDLSDKTIRSLTCQAFATAWGFRPSGQLEIPSSLMCTAGETAPAPAR